jgi:orotidine-5'-phosphate decarboxylase
MKGKERIILALDGIEDREKLKTTVHKLAFSVGLFKIGLELITKMGGPVAVVTVIENGGKVFFDGKFCDIPNTVGAAAKAAADLGVEFFNVHANCGKSAMQAAVANKGKSKVLVVTVLTSLSDEECISVFGKASQQKVLEFAVMAKDAGVDGLICSPKEVPLLRSRPDLIDLLLVTPGVRPEWAAAGDQKRVMTPGEAIKAGSDYLVIGRPITKPPENKFASSIEAAIAIKDEIEKAEIELGL